MQQKRPDIATVDKTELVLPVDRPERLQHTRKAEWEVDQDVLDEYGVTSEQL